MKTWNIIHYANVTADEQKNPAVIAKVAAAYNDVKVKRAEIIEAALSVEGLLHEVLLDILIGRDVSQRAVFKETVLLAEFCTYKQKWRMLRRLMVRASSYFDSFTEAERSSLRKDINTLIDDRNRFAHGDLIVDVKSNYQVLLRYYEDGIQYLAIADNTVADVLTKALHCRERLWELHSRFGTDIEVGIV